MYGGLGSGRLVIAGAPEAGKSGAAVLLALAGLRHRRTVAEADRLMVPVPVLFTLHDWNPATQPVRDWLVSQLRQTYDGLFTGTRGARKAAALQSFSMDLTRSPNTSGPSLSKPSANRDADQRPSCRSYNPGAHHSMPRPI